MTRKLRILGAPILGAHIWGVVAVFAVLSLAAVSGANAQVSINVGTGASGSANYNPFSASGGPFPFSNFGVQAGVNLGGTNVNLNLGGLTNFLLPQFTNNEVLTPGTAGAGVGYTPNWNGSISASSTLAANATFVYNLGPFSGSNNIYSQNLTNPLGGNLASGGALVGGSSSNTANGNLFSFGYTAGAPFASASATIDVGLQYQSSLSWNPATNYGVNSWISASPNGAVLGSVATSSVSSGALSYTIPDALGISNGEQVYLNLQPTVNLDLTIDPSSTISTPVSGNLNVQAFGDNIVNYNFPIANPFSVPINYDAWDASVNWNSGTVVSIPVIYEQVFGTHGNPCLGVNCSNFVVDDPAFTFQVPTIGNGGVNNLTGGGLTGGYNPMVNNGGLVPNICDPNNNTCYASNDPNLPVGQGTVMTSDTPVGAPEPGSLGMLGIGAVMLAVLGWATRRRESVFCVA
jgi:hypothetical protein